MTPKGLHVGAGAVARDEAEDELEPGDAVTVAFEVWKNAVCVTCADGVKRPFHGGIVDATVVTVDSTWGRYSRCYAVRVGSCPRAFVALVHHERCAKTAQETEGGGVAKPLCREFRRRAGRNRASGARWRTTCRSRTMTSRSERGCPHTPRLYSVGSLSTHGS